MLGARCASPVPFFFRFPIYEEGAAVTRRTEDVDENGPPMDFVDIELLPLREPEVAHDIVLMSYYDQSQCW